jgi:hypothetical protein
VLSVWTVNGLSCVTLMGRHSACNNGPSCGSLMGRLCGQLMAVTRSAIVGLHSACNNGPSVWVVNGRIVGSLMGCGPLICRNVDS